MNSPLSLHPKTAGASLSGALGILIVWILTLANVTVTPEVAAALVVALASLGSWLSPLLPGEPPVVDEQAVGK